MNIYLKPFKSSEASLAKKLFDQHLHLEEFDPTFCEWPIAEYQALIDGSGTTDERGITYEFCKLTDQTGAVIGYVQLEKNAPSAGLLWIAMLIVSPQHQGLGKASKAVKHIIAEAKDAQFSSIMMNIYRENVKAIKFWQTFGFELFQTAEPEEANNHLFHPDIYQLRI